MEAVFQIFKSNGDLQFDANIAPYVFSYKGSVQTQAPRAGYQYSAISSAYVPMRYNSDDLVVVRMDDGYGYARYADLQVDGTWSHIYHTTAPIGATVYYWTFVKGTQVGGGSNLGLELFDTNGTRTYSSEMHPLVIGGIVSGHGNSTSLVGGRSYGSIAPSLAGRHVDTYSGGIQRQTNDKGQTTGYFYDAHSDAPLYGVKWNGSSAQLVEVPFASQDYEQFVSNAQSPRPADTVEYDIDITDVLLIDVTYL